jgi:hypothetical protein
MCQQEGFGDIDATGVNREILQYFGTPQEDAPFIAKRFMRPPFTCEVKRPARTLDQRPLVGLLLWPVSDRFGSRAEKWYRMPPVTG